MSQQTAPFENVGRTPHTEGFVLALNAGSSSLKFALFDGTTPPIRILSGAIDRIGLPKATFTLEKVENQQTERAEISAPTHVGCLEYLLARLAETIGAVGFRALGHRVVHGGERYTKSQLVTPDTMDELRRITSFAPEHLPAEIAIITALRERFPKMPQVVCFDTAFHRDLPRVARLLPIPRRYEAAGVRRYGFHGLSYEFLMQELARVAGPESANGRVILAHLGNGASLAAVRGGKSIDTSMAFTPAAGLVMGRRSGDLDPGLVAYLASTEGMTPPEFHKLVNHQSGLLGVSEISSDMRELLAAEKTDARAAEAIALFCYQARKWVGSFAAALGGLDTLIFSGGIGENCPSIRARICEELDFLGIELNGAHNAKNAALISTDPARVAVRVVKTDEEVMIASSVGRVLGASARGIEI